MTRKLRSILAPGSPRWAVRRAQWRALGLTDEDLERPKIAIVNSSSGLAICFSHLDEIAAKMKEVIRAAGAVPFEVRTAAPSDFITSAGRNGGYILSARDLIVNDIEVVVDGALLDGMVCLTSCDKTVPGQLMAAARLNIPTIMVVCGYQPSGEYNGHHVDIEEVFLQANYMETGKITFEDLKGMTEQAILGPGVCPGMGTANSMHIVCEALGMTLPGTAPVLALSPKMWDAAELAGKRIVDMVWEDLKPRDILTPEAFANAVMTVLAVGGSINTVKHLQAVATEAQCDVDIVSLFERYAEQIPLLTAVRPNGEYSIEEFEAAGSTQAVLAQLAGVLHKEVKTVTGQSLGEVLRAAEVLDPEIIRPMSRPVMKRPAITMVRGSLAPDGGIVKMGIGEDRLLQFTGRAIVYNSQQEAVDGLKRGEVQPGHVVVMRGLGPKGGPGMNMASSFIFALDGAGLSESAAVVTDGQISGLVNRNLVVAEVSPEAAEGGPLALVENGDVISIDVTQRTVDLAVPQSELANRQVRVQDFIKCGGNGWLSIYQRLVRPLREGATLTE